MMTGKNKTPVKGRLGLKLLVGAGSLLFFLAVLEISIRLFVFGFFGYIRFKGADPHVRPGGKRILCVGDSYTFGGDLNSVGKAYPDILQRKLDAARIGDFSVINKGICETTTGELRGNLPGWLDRYKPEVVVMLVGSSNRFRSWENAATPRSSAFRWFADLRVVKMARIIRLNLKAKDAAGSFDGAWSKLSFLVPAEPNKNIGAGDAYMFYRGIKKTSSNWRVLENPVKTLWRFGESRGYEEGIAYGRSLLDGGEAGNVGVILALTDLYFSSGAYDDADALLTASRKRHPGSKILKIASAWYYVETAGRLRWKRQNEKSVKYYLKAIELDPNRGYNYYLMNKVFSLQSYYDSDRIYRELSRMARSNPAYGESEMFTKNLEYYRVEHRREAGIEQRAYNDLEGIAALCGRRKVRLIIMNYPINYPMANRALEKLAAKRKLPFVDNLAAFKDLKPKGKYFYDDDHCTLEGHRVVAGNAYKILDESGTISP